MNKLLVLGYFGYESNQLDGQTVKSRNICELLDTKLGRSYKVFDTEKLKINKLYYIQLLWMLITCNHLIYLPGKNNLNGLAKILKILISIKKTKVFYVVVGGWLPEYLSSNLGLLPLLKKFESIGTESKFLAQELRDKFDLQQAVFFPNFRIHEFHPDKRKIDGQLKLVFMARIMMEKGIDTVFKLAEFIDESQQNIDITFFGPVIPKDKDYFYQQLEKYRCVNYQGVLQPTEIYERLVKYDALLLPTRYEGEGFPGSILDAYISGLPVIVSNWKQLPEFVEDRKSGFVVNNFDELLDKVLYLKSNPLTLNEMKDFSNQLSSQYSSDVAWDMLDNFINN